ncbi:Syg1 family like protein [Aduncisulcus paluster]|uniref:Syg1 family like protein n=1 Tax=Aduncisulcus paluster TaxID=2918883 RepID=A0ABQ5K4W9_9EUKA|nr:Syg1 family like protein [Aduncisulcus paluster]
MNSYGISFFVVLILFIVLFLRFLIHLLSPGEDGDLVFNYKGFTTGWPVFSLSFAFSVGLFMWALDTKVFRMFSIDQFKVLGKNRNETASTCHILFIAMIYSCISLFICSFFIFSLNHPTSWLSLNIPCGLWIMIMYGIIMIILIVPIPGVLQKQQSFFMGVLVRWFVLPTGNIRFLDIICADIMTSFANPLKDFVRASIGVFTGTFLGFSFGQDSDYSKIDGEVIEYLTCFIVMLPYLARFLHWLSLNIPCGLWIMIMYGIIMIILIVPIPGVLQKQQSFFMGVLVRWFVLPTGNIRFLDIICADIMTSFANPLKDFVRASIGVFTGTFLGFSFGQDSDYSKIDGEVIEYLTCFIVMLPYLARFLQCLNVYHATKDAHNLINAGKYFTSLASLTASAVDSIIDYFHGEGYTPIPHIVWIVVTIISTIYSLVWDLLKDWTLFAGYKQKIVAKKENRIRSVSLICVKDGLQHGESLFKVDSEDDLMDSSPKSSQCEDGHDLHSSNIGMSPAHHKKCLCFDCDNCCWLLRSVRLYPFWFYITGIIEDSILRFAWSMTLNPPDILSLPAFLNMVLGMAEICRRMLWVILRVEWQFIHETSSLSDKLVSDREYQILPIVDGLLNPHRMTMSSSESSMDSGGYHVDL